MGYMCSNWEKTNSTQNNAFFFLIIVIIIIVIIIIVIIVINIIIIIIIIIIITIIIIIVQLVVTERKPCKSMTMAGLAWHANGRLISLGKRVAVSVEVGALPMFELISYQTPNKRFATGVLTAETWKRETANAETWIQWILTISIHFVCFIA